MLQTIDTHSTAIELICDSKTIKRPPPKRDWVHSSPFFVIVNVFWEISFTMLKALGPTEFYSAEKKFIFCVSVLDF